MGRKRKCQRRDDSSSSDASSGDDEMSSAATTRIGRTSESLVATEKRRNTRRKEDKGIKQMLKELKEETSEMRKELKILRETKDDTREIRKQLNELRKCLVHINGSSGDDSAAPRSESNQVQPPRYRLEFTCEVNDEIEKGQIIETKSHGETISVALKDDHNQIVEIEPLASATVMLVVVNGEFNQHGNQYNWLRKDFERNIKRPRQGNSAMGDVNQPIESIVSNCVFKLDGGVKSHTGATILCNSSNKKVRLGVMLLSRTEERVLEGLSNPFFVRGHDRPARQSNPHCNGSKRQKQALVGYDCQERNGPMLNMENPPWPIPTQPGGIRFDPVAAPNTILVSTESSISLEQASILQDPFSHPTIYGTSMAQATNSLPGANEKSPLHIGYLSDPDLTLPNYSTDNTGFPVPANGTQFNMDQIARPVQLVWDRPKVELRKSWNLLDQLMPLYSCPPKFYNSGLPTLHLMTEHLGSLTSTLKDVMRTTRRKKSVLIEPLEPDDSDKERPLKRKLLSKYRLRFVNKVCEAYYTWEKIKASDGDLLKVALFDENNIQITSGPLSSASVEVVVLHGDFNVDGQQYWTLEEFSGCVLCPKAGKEPILGGDLVLALADGEACIRDAFFQITSCHARTGKFKIGVVLASAQDERIQEGISEPCRARERRQEGLPSGFRFHPTDEELILYLRNRVAAVPCPFHVIADDIYTFDPWDLPCKAVYGDGVGYLVGPRVRKYPNGIRPSRRTRSGYWKSIGTDKPIHDRATSESVGFKNALVFYKGRPPRGSRTDWRMYEYRLASNTANMLQEWVLCRLYKKAIELQPSTTEDDRSVVNEDDLPRSPRSPRCCSRQPRMTFPSSTRSSDLYQSSFSDQLEHHLATAEPSGKLPVKTAQPQLRSTTEEGSGSQFLVCVSGNENST